MRKRTIAILYLLAALLNLWGMSYLLAFFLEGLSLDRMIYRLSWSQRLDRNARPADALRLSVLLSWPASALL